MSKINGDKARHNLRKRRQAKARVSNQAMRATLQFPLKTSIVPDAAPKASSDGPKKSAAAPKPASARKSS